jgi:hypothetical protein
VTFGSPFEGSSAGPAEEEEVDEEERGNEVPQARGWSLSGSVSPLGDDAPLVVRVADDESSPVGGIEVDGVKAADGEGGRQSLSAEDFSRPMERQDDVEFDGESGSESSPTSEFGAPVVTPNGHLDAVDQRRDGDDGEPNEAETDDEGRPPLATSGESGASRIETLEEIDVVPISAPAFAEEEAPEFEVPQSGDSPAWRTKDELPSPEDGDDPSCRPDETQPAVSRKAKLEGRDHRAAMSDTDRKAARGGLRPVLFLQGLGVALYLVFRVSFA